jgi:hypothetical protein
VRALLLKPAALGAAIGLAFFGVAVLLVCTFAAHAAVFDSGAGCSSPPTTATVLSSYHSAVAGARVGQTRTVASVSASSIESPTSSPTAGGPASTLSPSATQTPSTSTSSSTSAGSNSEAEPDQSSSPTDTTSPGSSTSPTPTPTPSTSSPPPTPQLCVLVQSYPSDGDVLAGDSASYVVWVWSLTADSSNVSVAASVTAASYLGSPGFMICPSASGATCAIASLPVGDVYELLAAVPVTSAAPLDTDIDLTATATATGATSGSSSATDTVVAPTTAASNSASSDDSSNAVPPLVSLPSIPGTGVTATNPSVLFPTVSPSTSTGTGTGTLALPPAKVHHVVSAAETAYAVPVDPRLLGAQIVGLVALAGAITIAIVRLSLRKPLAASPQPADPGDKTAAS